MGAKTINYSAESSVGRALELYRKLRKEHPQLVAEVDIMSQPANVQLAHWGKLRSILAHFGSGAASAQTSLSLPLNPWL